MPEDPKTVTLPAGAELKYNSNVTGLPKPEGAIVDKESGAWLVNTWTTQKWGLTFKTKVWSDGDVEEVILLPDGTELASLRGSPLKALRAYLGKHPYASTLIFLANLSWTLLLTYLRFRGWV